jgi:ferredoxin
VQIHIDRDKCCGYGNCVLAAPDVFALDDISNLAVALVTEPDEALRPAVDRAIDECPTEAITTVA